MSQGAKVLAVVGGLLFASLMVLAFERAFGGRAELAAVRGFQRMAGGLGLGATVAPRWCLVNFDPRIERCTCAEQPLPGGYCYCPEHSGTVSFFGSLWTEPVVRERSEGSQR